MVKFDSVAFVFFLAAPFKCKEDIIPNNEQVLQCQANAALGAEYVSIFQVSIALGFFLEAT